MSKSASLATQFRDRRGVFSDRISARGHRYEFSELDSLHADMKTQILQKAVALKAAMESPAPDALAQVNRLRGQLGNLRQIAAGRVHSAKADIFMTCARELLPQDIFDAILVQVRWMESLEAKETAAMLDGVFKARSET